MKKTLITAIGALAGWLILPTLFLVLILLVSIFGGFLETFTHVNWGQAMGSFVPFVRTGSSGEALLKLCCLGLSILGGVAGYLTAETLKRGK